MSDKRALPRKLARESLEKGDATGWFEQLYSLADRNEAVVPWADMAVNPHFADWLKRHALTGSGQEALVIGCGLGDDAEALAQLGFKVVAIDVAPTAIAWCLCRFPQSLVDYTVADVLALPPAWARRFAFVLEVYTLQVLPSDLRPRASEQMARVVAADGTLLVVARGREPADDAGSMPWPLTRDELQVFVDCGLREVRCEDFLDDEDPPVRRFRAEFRRPGSA